LKCNNQTSEYYLKEIIGKEAYSKIEQEHLDREIGVTFNCINCKEKIAFEKGVVDYNVKDDKNNKLSKDAAEDYSAHRCKCPYCKVEFCVECKSSPYHLGNF